MKLFISYSHKDANFVNPVVSELSKNIDKNSILFDEWNIKPGDSIVGFMNSSLESFTHFIFFLSPNSVDSYMASLEWKNALILCSNKNRHFIPVIINSPKIPPILGDFKYIDSNLLGIDETIKQIFISISKSVNGETIYANDNLAYTAKQFADNKIEITIKARYYSEPNSSFCIAFLNSGKILVNFAENFQGSSEIREVDGNKCWLQFVRLFRTLTPGAPVVLVFSSEYKLSLFSIMHVHEDNGNLKGIPILLENS